MPTIAAHHQLRQREGRLWWRALKHYRRYMPRKHLQAEQAPTHHTQLLHMPYLCRLRTRYIELRLYSSPRLPAIRAMLQNTCCLPIAHPFTRREELIAIGGIDGNLAVTSQVRFTADILPVRPIICTLEQRIDRVTRSALPRWYQRIWLWTPGAGIKNSGSIIRGDHRGYRVPAQYLLPLPCSRVASSPSALPALAQLSENKRAGAHHQYHNQHGTHT